MDPTTPTIELWFDFASNYSYLAVMRIEALADAAGVRVEWKPFLLGPIFRSFGWSDSPFVLQKEKGEYTWKDMARQCAKYGIPWRMPSRFPRLSVLPARVMLAAGDAPWATPFAKRMMLANFRDDREIGEREPNERALLDLGLPAAEILERAGSEAVKSALREQTEVARRRRVFGAPTFFVRGEMYWGNDRLEDALGDARAGRPPR